MKLVLGQITEVVVDPMETEGVVATVEVVVEVEVADPEDPEEEDREDIRLNLIHFCLRYTMY